jgi:HK97 family phage prohead protease
VKASTATTERTLLALAFWLKRQDTAAAAALVGGLTDAERREAGEVVRLPGMLERLWEMPDTELAERMLSLGGKSALPVPPAPERKVLAGAAKSAMAPAQPDTDLGTFTGYLAVLGNRDGQGDTLLLGSLDDTLAEFKAGARRWLLTDSHSDRASDVVAEVVDAAVDSHGLKVWGRWMPTSRAQELRQMVREGGRLGLSIDYHAERARPDGAGGRALARVSVYGGAITPRPANGLATIVEGKQATVVAPAGRPVVHQWAPVVTVEEAISQGAARRDPDRDRLRRMAKALEAASWPPRELVAQIGLEAAYGLLESAASAKAMRQVQGDPERALARQRRDAANDYSNGLAAAMTRGRDPGGCGSCYYCRANSPGCIYR